MRNESWRTFVLTGDGELQEGSNWEAAMTANHYGLDNLVVIVDRNRIQQGDFTEKTIRMDPLPAKWEAFGFRVVEINGHEPAELYEALSRVPRKKTAPPVLSQTQSKETASPLLPTFPHGTMVSQPSSS